MAEQGVAFRYGRYWDATREAPAERKDDRRRDGQIDSDRVLYTEAFRRLDGVTQVITPQEQQQFHTRLTHTLEVAQLARRTAERLLDLQPGLEDQLDLDVVQAAAYIHDLGHPPFGHVAEDELDKLVLRAGDTDGFEGNAQSFRIVTRLAPHWSCAAGLDLTRATLNASLKYAGFNLEVQHRDKRPRAVFYTPGFSWAGYSSIVQPVVSLSGLA